MATLRDQIPLQRRKIIKKSFNHMLRMIVVAVILTVVAGLLYYYVVLEMVPEAIRAKQELGPDYIAIAWLVLMVLLILWAPFYEYLYFKTYFYDMDANNFVIRKGIMAKREITLPFSKITDVYVDQDILDVLLGLYHLHISSPTAESGRFAHIDGLNKYGAGRLRKIILDKIHALGATATNP